MRRLQSFTPWLCSDVDPCLVWHLITWVYRFEFILGPLNFAVRGFVFAPQWPIMRCLSSLRGLVRQKIMVIGGLGPNPNLPNVRAAALSLFTSGLSLVCLSLRIFYAIVVVAGFELNFASCWSASGPCLTLYLTLL